MKLLTAAVLMLSLSFLVGCGGQAQTEEQAKDSAAIVNASSNVATAKVEGMTCGVCEGTVCSALQGLEGVEAVIADAATGEVKIALKDGATLDTQTVSKAVTDASAGHFKMTGELVLPEPEEDEAPDGEENPA